MTIPPWLELGGERHAGDGHRVDLTSLDLVGQYTECERARQLRRPVRSVAIDEYARQLRNLGDPATVGFLLKFDRQRHASRSQYATIGAGRAKGGQHWPRAVAIERRIWSSPTRTDAPGSTALWASSKRAHDFDAPRKGKDRRPTRTSENLIWCGWAAEGDRHVGGMLDGLMALLPRAFVAKVDLSIIP